jgi:hypothetical protein
MLRPYKSDMADTGLSWDSPQWRRRVFRRVPRQAEITSVGTHGWHLPDGINVALWNVSAAVRADQGATWTLIATFAPFSWR